AVYGDAAARFALELKRTVQLAHAFPDIHQPKPPGYSRLLRRATHSTIRHCETNAAVGARQPDLYVLGL
ncbi:MAG TPA: hypothetical protein VKK81_11850, partial [Candidatus Binatia bacterium]|nr:hypothetical protein [Candidatus Binatia bacterium]